MASVALIAVVEVGKGLEEGLLSPVAPRYCVVQSSREMEAGSTRHDALLPPPFLSIKLSLTLIKK